MCSATNTLNQRIQRQSFSYSPLNNPLNIRYINPERHRISCNGKKRSTVYCENISREVHFAYFLYVSDDMRRECCRKSREWNFGKRKPHLADLFELFAECPSPDSMRLVCSNQCEPLHESAVSIILCYR